MPRRRQSETSLFNFSFVDILATTIGVIIFILVLVLINAADRLSPDKLQRTLRETEEASEENRRRAKELRDRAAAERRRLEESKTSPERRQLAEKAVEGERKKKERLDSEQKELKDRAGKLERELDNLQKELEQFAKSAKEVDRSRSKVEFRVPRLRTTSKEPYTFECDGGRIYFLATFRGGINEKNYNVQSLGFAAIITRKSGAKGDRKDAVGDRDSLFMKAVRRMKKAGHFGNFVVRPDGFDVFRAARKLLWDRGFDVNWAPLGEKEKIIAGGGGGSHSVQ